MRARSIIVKNIPKIHYCDYPAIIDHFHNHPLTIPLHLHGIFSFFHHHVPTIDELHGCDKIFITPDSTTWNPHCDSFSRNE